MDHKQFKLDLIYVLKKIVKEGKTIVSDTDNLEIVDDKFVCPGNNLEALEALALIKGYAPVPERLWGRYHEAYGVGVIDAVALATGISKNDLYEFWNGAENVDGNQESEFYKVGVYVREKFTPLGVRAELLKESVYQGDLTLRDPIKTFYVQAGRKISIYEIEAQEVTHNLYEKGMSEDIKSLWFPNGERYFKVLNPKSLWNNLLTPMIILPYEISETLDVAQDKCEAIIRGKLDLKVRKSQGKEIVFSYTDEDVKAEMLTVKKVML